MVDVIGIDGKKIGSVKLPEVFNEPYRPDLIKRAVVAAQANRRQPYGSDPLAGKRTSARYFGSRDAAPDKRMMNREMSRLPRIFGDTSYATYMKGAFAPQAVGGRRAHPPKVEKIWEKKINDKERRKAIRSAIAGTARIELIKERGHLYDGNVPIVVDDKIECVNSTKSIISFLEKVGLSKELERCKEKKIRAGKGKMRGRRYRRKVGGLFVVSEDKGISRAVKNIPGFEVVDVDNLNAELLSPGAHGIRLTIWTKSALKRIGERLGI
ncbi:MAG: 50S ribosomal protein L4 [Candidatus Aenigmatarchaeota archaeon]|nr:MAG: 50S ribosomal protein L4 [Candidatus Aenigmarchaeota archaeon]